jgi:glycine/betaine/sarcosine/D-proline reductase family selenoprotein B
VTSLTSVAVKVGANRVVRGNRFSHPCGNPMLDPAGERAWRIALVRAALDALRTAVEGPTLFEPAGSGG